MRKNGGKFRWYGLLLAAAVAALVLVPIPTKKTFSHRGACDGARSVEVLKIRLDRPIENINLRLASRLSAGEVRAKLTSGESWAWFPMRGRASRVESFSFGKPFQPGVYDLEVTEMGGARGTYSVEVLQDVPVSAWQRLLAVLTAVVAASAVWAWLAARRYSAGDARRRSAAWQLRVFGFALFLMLLYPTVHETGHNLGLAAFGACDIWRTDFIGLHGTPHSGYRAGAVLQPWQRSIVSVGGPVFPTLVGFALFAAWRLCGRTRRSLLLESAWLWATGLLLFPQVLAGIPQALGLMHDGDYQGYIGNFPGPVWVGNGLMLALSLLTIPVLVLVVRRLLAIGRELLPRTREAGEAVPAG